ncbi:uncharacterized protein [Dermacentor albipictus]|uniref:uncharacterized protein n=1 Tax=Dermacentor albipictus TaxID=60249 RepID=UPI0038FCE191
MAESDMADAGSGQEGENVPIRAGEQLLTKEVFELEKLRLMLEMEKIKLAQMQLQPLVDAQRGQRQLSGIKLGEYAKELKAVLAPMPEADPTVPAWFKSVDTLFETLQIPEDIRGVILLPFLNEKMKAFVASESDGSVMPYPELKEKILKELKMTPNEYRRLFLSVKKEQDDSWHQVATRLETLFSYYLKSRDVTTLKDLKDLVIADRFKQILSEEVRTYVMQNEVTHWLVASEIAELAETYEESRRVGWTRERSDKPLCEGDRRVGKTSGQTGNAGKKTRTEAIRCFQCKKFGHYASNCPDPRHGFEKVQPEEENSKIVARAEIIVSDSFRPQVEQCDKVNQQAASEVLNWVDLEVGGNSVRACLDSGAEITVLRTETVPEACKGKSSGKIKLKGAFGQVVDADLLYLPLSLAGEDGCRHQQVLILCAVTDVLSKGIGALLTPEAHELLESAKMELEEEAQDRATLEQAFITTENAVADWPEWGPELDDDEEAEEDVMVASVGLAGNEAMGSDDASPAARFRVEQKEDNSLGEAWKQAVDDHMQHLGKVLATLKQVGLTANPAKCKFAQTKVKYLGHVVGSGTHSPDPDRVSAIFKLQAPKTKRDLRSVLGLFNYYRDEWLDTKTAATYSIVGGGPSGYEERVGGVTVCRASATRFAEAMPWP